MTPEAEVSPFDPAITELEARIKSLQNTLETLKQLRSGGADGPVPSAAVGTSLRPGDAQVQHDSFFGMTIAEATKKYLNMVKHTKSTGEIAHALETGGLKHASKDFHTTLRSTLGGKEEFLRVNGEWGLAEWYPGMGRGRTAKAEKPKKRAKEQRQAHSKAKKHESSAAATEKEKAQSLHGQNGFSPQSLNGRVLQLLNGSPKKMFNATVAAQELNEQHVPSVLAALSKLLKAGLIERPKTGHYMAREAQK